MRWARESIGYTEQEAAALIGIRLWKLLAVEQGSEFLTVREAEKAADVYERPLAALFVPAPPEEEPQEAVFRRLPGAPEPPWPPAMRLLARRIRERQDAAAELYAVLEEEPPWHVQRSELPGLDDPKSSAAWARKRLGVTLDQQFTWQSADLNRPLRAWVDAVEGLGILVMQDGSMPVETMRGFASVHVDVPAVVVNTKDDPRARAFTVLHELGHLLLAAADRENDLRAEAWCNEFAGQVLMPQEDFARAFAGTWAADPVERVRLLARRFGVTPMAAAVRVSKYSLLPSADAERIISALLSRPLPAVEDEDDDSPHGNYYWNQIGRLGPGFIRLVFAAVESQAITYPAASGLLGGVKVSNFAKLRDHLSRRR